MSVHRISLNPPQGDDFESLEGIMDALHTARDLANMLTIGAESLPKGTADAFGTTAILLEGALVDIADRIEVVAKERRAVA